ncbi:MAG TPA: [protein-PII] uridylyltransferase, partial [Gammaproteobacteria bacterium]|nr:[protein-PII] uridylyltransferase [Gammaproteobacteria bacterium]
IKEGPGGLRDIQNILWVTRRHFGSSSPQGLVDHHFLTPEECRDLEKGQERLWEIRFALHLIAGRAEERLLFEHQPALARHFGETDNHMNRGVEAFMHGYFRTIRELSLLNEMLLQLFEEQLLTPKAQRIPTLIDEHFGIQGGYLALQKPDSLNNNPNLILSLFLVLCKHPKLKGVTAETIRQIRSAGRLIDNNFRQDYENQQLFLQLFVEPEGLTHLLRRMNRYGILGAYLPEFEKIIGLMQHDLFHAYTVDEHTLFVIRNLRRLTVPEFHHEIPRQSDLILQLKHPERLYLAALFHDIAKGRGGDHSKLGIEIVEDFCRQHRMSPESSKDIAWLVENHLVMSTFAQRRDIDDPEEIHTFAQLVETQYRLEMLYLLTVADIRATNRSLWNHFKDSLLGRLFALTTEALKRLHRPEGVAEWIEEHRQQALLQLQQQGFEAATIHTLWDTLEEEYFQKHDAEEITWHTRSILNASELPLININRESTHGGSEILIYSQDKRFLFPILVHTIESLGLDIHAAKINTTLDSFALDVFTVLTQNGKILQDRELIEKIRRKLLQEIEEPTLLAQPVAFRRSRHEKHFHEESTVAFQQDEHKQQTILEVHATNRSGLLSSICRNLMECDIRVQGAKIATLGERVEDLFWVTHQNSTPLQDEEKNQAVSRQIKLALDPS